MTTHDRTVPASFPGRRLVLERPVRISGNAQGLREAIRKAQDALRTNPTTEAYLRGYDAGRKSVNRDTYVLAGFVSGAVLTLAIVAACYALLGHGSLSG